jgi:hypothetical protein
MPKKLKLDLNGLKVASFVTSLGKDEHKKVIAGRTWTDFGTCSCDGACDPTTVLETCVSCNITCGDTCEVCSAPEPCSINPDCTINPMICKTAAC